MPLFLTALIVFAIGAVWPLIGRKKWSNFVGPLAAVIGSLLAAGVGLYHLFNNSKADLILAWPFPLGSFHIGFDPLTSIFVLPVGIIGALAAIYGHTYLQATESWKKLSSSWSLYNLFVAFMLLALVARNGFLFLMAWELMSLSSFFLVLFDHEKKEVGRAGWIYFIAAHIGAAFLLAMFILLDSSGTMEFSLFSAHGQYASVIFILSLVGFGSKAGIVPLHVWLPEAHPAAPSHVSAVMSGVMIKLGIYGILRVLLFLGKPDPWWGWSLIAIGAISGILGVLYALAQHDLKRLLAYHSVENIGVILLGIGIGVLGVCSGNILMATMGLGGGLLHALNHAVFKSLLFLGAGALKYSAGTLEIDRLGGLFKRMPVTGLTFLIGSIAISALPPLNGFISEFFIYFASLSGVSTSGQPWAGVIVIASLAIIGALAAACFSKAFGIAFLGEPRSESASEAHEVSRKMLIPMILLAGFCVFMGSSGAWLLRFTLPVANQFMPIKWAPVSLDSPLTALKWITATAVVFMIFAAAIAAFRKVMISKRPVRKDVTWGCGYIAPSSKMQYTSSSFAQPIINMFRTVLRPNLSFAQSTELFPKNLSLHSHTDDLFLKHIFRPLFESFIRLAGGLRRIQTAGTHTYIMYIALTILALLVWRLW